MAERTNSTKIKGKVVWSPTDVRIIEDNKDFGELEYSLAELLYEMDGKEVDISIKEKEVVFPKVGEEDGIHNR